MRIGFSYATLEIAGAAYKIAELAGREAVSSLFEFQLGFPVPVPIPAATDFVGASATLVLEDRIGNARRVSGVVSACVASASEVGVGEIRLSLRPVVFGLALGRSSRTFQEKTLKEIFAEVLASVPHAFRFDASAKLPYRVQRAESDWDFVERTIADAGLVYFFDHSAGSELVIADAAERGGFIEGEAMPVHLGSMIGAVPEGIVGMAKVGAAASTSHAMKGFRSENPTFAVEASGGGGRYESYDRVLEVRGLNDIDAKRVSVAAGRASTARVVGTARSVRLYPGMSFTAEEAGAVVVHETVMSIEDGDLEGASAIVVAFSSAAAGAGAHPERKPPPRTTAGLSLAIISADAGDEVFPEGAGRVRAQHHWDRSGAFDAGAGTWLRPTQRLAPGSMMFPRTGWVVAAMAQCGDADSPIALGRIHDGTHPPSYPLPENKTRVVYKTATSPGGGSFNEIHFEDKKGAEVMYIHASKNTDVLTKQYKTERVMNDATHTVDGEQRFDHQDALDTKVMLDQTVTIGRNEIVKTGASFAKNVSGTESITIANRRKITGKDMHNTGVKKDRTLKVGAALIDISLGQIARSAKNAVTLVGGLVMRVTKESLSRQVGPVAIETVGGLKYEKAGHSLSDSAAKELVETVGGSITLTAGTNINEDVQNEARWTVAGKMSGSADEGLLEAHEKIEIVCGNSVLTLDDKTLTLSSTEIELSGGSLEVLSGVISHN